MYRQSEKNLLSSDISSTCPHNMVNFGLLAAEIVSGVWGTPATSTASASWQRYCTESSSERQPNFAALNRWRHLCSTGRPSCWALAHISCLSFFLFFSFLVKSLSIVLLYLLLLPFVVNKVYHLYIRRCGSVSQPLSKALEFPLNYIAQRAYDVPCRTYATLTAHPLTSPLLNL